LIQVESRRQVVKLEKQLEQINAYNTELVIDIRGMKEKFRQMTEREKHMTAERVMAPAPTVDSSRQQSEPDYEQVDNTLRGNESGLVAMEHFASVWSAHDDDDLADDISERIHEEDGEAETPKHVAASSMRSSLRSGTMGSLENDSGEDQPQNNPGGIVSGIAAGGAALLGRFVYARKSSRMVTEVIVKDKDEDDLESAEIEKPDMIIEREGGYDHEYKAEQEVPIYQHSLSTDSMPPPEPILVDRGSAESWGSFAEESTGRCLPEDDILALDKAMDSDDLVALEAEALMLAEQFKMTSTFLESVSDLQKSVDESGGEMGMLSIGDVSKITTSTGDIDNINKTINDSMFGSPERSVNKSTASTEIMYEYDSPIGASAIPSAGEASGAATKVGSWNVESIRGRSMQNAGEPSGYRVSPSEFLDQMEAYEDDYDDDDQHHLKPPIPFQYQNPRKPLINGWLAGQRLSLSSSTSTHDSPASHSSQKNIPFPIADWSAVGLTGGLLADLSDSASTSSYAESYVDSSSELGDTVRSSDFDVPLLDQLVADSDFEAVKVAAAGMYDDSSLVRDDQDDSENDRLAKILENKKKKRELEAWKISLARSFEKG
jgi:hypothetical protein